MDEMLSPGLKMKLVVGPMVSGLSVGAIVGVFSPVFLAGLRFGVIDGDDVGSFVFGFVRLVVGLTDGAGMPTTTVSKTVIPSETSPISMRSLKSIPGLNVGLRVGENDGESVGSSALGLKGIFVGFLSGLEVGLRVGDNDGEGVGSSVFVGLRVGDNDGEGVGSSVFVGLSVGETDGDGVRSPASVGLSVGENDGERVGSSVFVVGMSPELFVSGMKTGLSVGARVLFFL
jgi:hypothetical protein